LFESLRVTSPVNNVTRCASRDTSIRSYTTSLISDNNEDQSRNEKNFKELFIKKGQEIILLINAIHHDPRYWDNPQEFMPQRWLVEDSEDGRFRFKFAPKHHSAFLPFAQGSRGCIGKNFALMESRVILAIFLFIFDFKLVQEIEGSGVSQKNYMPRIRITTSPKDPYFVQFQIRKHLKSFFPQSF